MERKTEDRPIYMCRTYPSGSTKYQKVRGKTEGGRSCSWDKKHLSYYLTVAVKSNGDISAEPIRGQKIEIGTG